MARYWWVNHKQTHALEIAGSYMWSPKRESDGKRSQYYENMRIARPGDLVIAYAGGAVRAIGTVIEAAMDAPRPEEFGSVGLHWAARGWLVAVAWQPINPVRPKDMLVAVAALLPKKYSPLQAANGDGNQKAYLSEISPALFELFAHSSGVTPLSTVQATGILTPDYREALDDAEEQRINADLTLSDTEKVQLSKARRGQGIFRKNLLSIEKCCRLTGITNPCLLIASHIRPWRSCETAQERLDGHNGLLLAPQVDYLFDRGLISFDASGNLMISAALAAEDFASLGLEHSTENTFTDKQLSHLAYHREFVFQGA